ncbi:DUF2071 domain-containing protein [Cytophagaceae bacterium YF14B1]|uniref:DUF2071 domain-containing protein n=1 Tax=Xanthocytophaga flava TaxID=3048013 RepID=A0AAE3QZA5_9BACT|nr:DUF2071 domain-containing protein [Xanthocytophaga flavus]MDJ1486178.1 DUF2071 domain-containing protein [Xanthocytophaga flavus]
MIDQLKRHPFPVVAHFKFSLVLSYAMPQEVLQPLLPPHLELDTFNDFGFVTVAMVQTENLRPAGFPEWMGQNFFLIGYRLFVRYHTTNGKRLRGLYILRSETDKLLMKTLGNILTHYHYALTDIQWNIKEKSISVVSKVSDLHVDVQWNDENSQLPENSVFTNWKEARRFAGPLPFTFDFEPKTNHMTIIEGVRENWTPLPVNVQTARIGFLNNTPFDHPELQLSNAFVVQNIPYRWEKGRIENVLQ